jgi:hypothetical protein
MFNTSEPCTSPRRSQKLYSFFYIASFYFECSRGNIVLQVALTVEPSSTDKVCGHSDKVLQTFQGEAMLTCGFLLTNLTVCGKVSSFSHLQK